VRDLIYLWRAFAQEDTRRGNLIAGEESRERYSTETCEVQSNLLEGRGDDLLAKVRSVAGEDFLEHVHR
jgi:hypothetical protein